jgi:hypothetical protein
MAAVLACGPRAVLSHRSAAALHGIRRDNRAKTDVTVPSTSARSRSTIDVHTSLTLTAAEFGAVPGYLKAWYQRFGEGEPYSDAVVQVAINRLLTGRSAYYVPKSSRAKSPMKRISLGCP